MPEKTKDEVYGAMNKGQKYEAIAEAETPQKLDSMWASWEKRGHSREGLLYAAVLKRKAELGVELDDEQQAAVELAELRKKRAKDLPKITGRPGGGG